MTDKNTTHLAGEFLVAGELSRRGYPVSITMGNAKSVDIYASTLGGKETIRIDAKASRTKTSWPISEESVKEDLYYIFVYLQTKEDIKKNFSSEYFIVRGSEIKSNELIKHWKSIPGISYTSLKTAQYENRWDSLPSP